MQQFGCMEPKLVVQLLRVYSTAIYGSCLWQLNSEEHFRLNRAWNTATKIIRDLPHATHTRFLESFSPVPHLESVLAGRYIGFIQNLKTSDKPALSLLFNSCKNNLASQLEVLGGEAQQAVPVRPDQGETAPEETEGAQLAS